MRPDAPSVRRDLEFSEVDGQDGVEIIVHDPVSHTYHRLDPLQTKVLQALDGNRSLAEIAATLSVELDAEIPLDVLRALVARVRDMGLLDAGSAGVVTAEVGALVWKRVRQRLDKAGVVFRTSARAPTDGVERRRRPEVAQLFDEALRHLERGRPTEAVRALHAVLELGPDNARAAWLKQLIGEELANARRPPDPPTLLRIPLFDPEPVLDALLKWLRPIVSWKGYALAFLWFSFGAALGTPAAERMGVDLARLPQLLLAHPAALLIVYALMMVQFVGHELMHGLACRSFGGRVPSIGILLAFFIFPGAYCDTSATYTFRNRWNRVLVAAAGISWQMILFPIAIAIYLAAPRGTLLSVVALGEALSCWGVVIFTVVPFFKNDGYYMLADAVGVPRLWEISRAYTTNFVQRKLLGIEPDERAAAMTEGAGFGIACYALAGVTSTMVLTVFVYTTVTFPTMATAFRGPGLLLAMVPFSLVVVPPTLRALRLIRDRWAEVVRSRRAWGSATLLVMVLVFAGVVPVPWSVEVPFQVPPAQDNGWVELSAPRDAVLASLEVREGDRVSAGQVVARLDDTTQRLAVVDAEAALERARSTLTERTRKAEDRREVLEKSAKVASALEAFAARRTRNEAALVQGGLLEAVSADSARLRKATATSSSIGNSAELAVVRAELSVEARQQLERDVELAELHLRQHRDELEQAVIRAPHDGIVVSTCARRGEVAPRGVVLAHGAVIVKLKTTQPVIATLKVPVEYRRLLSEGQPVRLWLDHEWLESSLVVPDFVSSSSATVSAMQSRNLFVQATKLVSTSGIQERGLIELRTAPVSVESIAGRATGAARISLSPATLLQYLAWKVKYFIGYYWWTLW